MTRSERRAAQRAKDVEARARAKEKEAERRRAAADRERERRDVERRLQEERRARERAASAEAKARRQEAVREAELKRERVRREKEAREQAKAELVERASSETTRVRFRRQQLSTLMGQCVLAGQEDEPDPVVGERVSQRIASADYPAGIPSDVGAAYRPDARELLLERELPPKAIIPLEKEYRVVKGEVRPIAIKTDELRSAYSSLLGDLAMRTLAEAFDVTTPSEVASILLNAYVTAIDPATGKQMRPCLLSVEMTREFYDSIDVHNEEFDSKECLKRCDALLSDHPHDLVPVKPILAYSLERFKIIAGMDIAIDLDSRLDLLTLKPFEFESLIKQLFDARGLKSWQTQESYDEGVDAVVVNEDPVTGGVVVIQAKRYKRPVTFESITALAGVMHAKNAVRGILVTTSWAGVAGHRFASENRIQIIEAPELKQQLKEHLEMDVLISLPVLPRAWKRSDVA